MKQITIFIYFVLLGYCLAPHIGCPAGRPFIWPVKQCGSFSDICMIPGSFDCDYGIRACQQCSPSTFSSTILNQLMKMMYPANGKKGSTPETIRGRSSDGLLWTIIIIALFVLVISILIFIENKTRCLRFYRQRRRQKRKDCEMAPERENLISNTPALMFSISEDKLKQILEKIGISTCFEIPEFHKSVEITVYENDNIVIIKQKICMNLLNTRAADNFKKMQLQYNDRVLDDNQYLAKIIGMESNPILCYMNEELENCTTLLQLRGNIYVPEMIQLEKCVHISQLKQIVNKENIDPESLFIIKGSEILELNKTIEECDLIDNDIIKVIKREKRTIIVKQIFEGYAKHEDVTLHIDNIEKVGKIKSEILKELNMKSELKDIFLFYESNYLNDDMFYYELDSGESTEMSYCNFVEESFFLKGQKPRLIGTGDHNEIYECLDWNQKEIILKKSNSDIIESQRLINELMMFNETKTHPRFVNLLGIFRDETSFYVAVEKMSNNSITHFMKNASSMSDSLIIKWSQQILEGLEFLHSRKIVHRNIKPSNILLNDDGNNVKISSFGLSRRLYGPKGTVEEILFSKDEILRYMAPEMYLTKFYNFKSDVYSFGATLTEIATGKVPYEDQLIGNNFLEQIKNLDGLTFSSENQKLNNFVNRCIQFNYQERPFISELRFYKFLRQKK